MEGNRMKFKNRIGWLESIYVLVLGLYPLRHIYWGLDLWDTGYNYANFEYMGQEHMDSMWLFSTYLANVVGNFLMKLPAAGSLAGMNFYTALFVSLLALTGYFFCTRKLKMPAATTFIGEFAAISLCWCPTAKLYDYLTYVLFLICVIFLYLGLTQEKNRYLFIAGICLGSNVLVRFSNLSEAALIVAVWAYGVIEYLEWRKDRRTSSGMWGRNVNRTLWCLGGYLTALAVFFGHIALRYGLNEYIAGIQRLFAMTDKAADYKPASMLMGIVHTYMENMYWVARIGVIVIAGVLFYAFIMGALKSKVLVQLAEQSRGWKGFCGFIRKVTACFWVAIALAMLYWLYYREFCSFAFYSYDSILRPGILFLMLTMGIAVLRIFQRNSAKEEKLISGMILLVVLLTSIGSNNGVYPSLNNLFLAAPYTLWQCWLFLKGAKEKVIRIGKNGEITLHPFAAKCIGTAFLAMFLFQSVLFGAKFVFAEATGVQDISATVDNNRILKGIQMSPERAEWLSTISAYVEENDLQGKEVILYGWIPSLSYYLQMPPAFNSWSDLASYSITQMEVDMAELTAEIDEKGAERPVVIANKTKISDMEQDAKWQMVVDFMEKYGYEQTFSNEKFVMWE